MKALHRRLAWFGLAVLLGSTVQCSSSGGSECNVGAEDCSCADGGLCLAGLTCFKGMCMALPDAGSDDDGDSQPPSSSEPTTANNHSSTTAGDPDSGDSTATAASATTTGTTAPVDTTGTSNPIDTTGPIDTTADTTTTTDTTDTTTSTTQPDTTDTTSETTAPAEECGNGIIEGAEACDDGNDVDADACSNACKSNTPLIAFVDPVKVKMYGDTVGDPFDLHCDNVVGGIFGDTNAEAVLGIGASCKHLGLNKVGADYTITSAPTASLPYKGTQNGMTQASTCGAGEVAVGYAIGTADGLKWVTGLWISCAKLSLVDGVLVLGQPTKGPVIGGDDIYIGATCPKGSIITGHHGYASTRLYGIGFHCAKPVAIFE